VKVLGLCGSRRRGGNTALLLEEAMGPFREAGWEGRILYPGEMALEGCRGCEGCARTNRCVIGDDMEAIYAPLREADALIIGSPTYFYNMSSDMKRVIDRLYCLTSYDREDRSAWISELERGPRRFAGTIAVCEQLSEEDLGYTSVALDSAFASLGYRIVFSQKVLHAFGKGEAAQTPAVIGESRRLGFRLLKTCELARQPLRGTE